MNCMALAGEEDKGHITGTLGEDADDAEEADTGAEAPAPGYGNGPGYWDARYRDDPEPFEWLENFSDLRALLEDVTRGNTDIRILHVGCGNSLLTERMYDEGYHSIVNIDTSAVVIEQMLERNRDLRPEMAWEIADATATSYEDASFGLVLDKSVLDTFACTDNAVLLIASYLKEIERILRPEGTYLCVSYGAPVTRLPFLQMPHLDMAVEFFELPARYESSNAHHAYICKKPRVPSGAAVSWEEALSSLQPQASVCSGSSG